MRDKSGRFVKGYSGNAGGRPKDEHNIAALARSYSTEAIETLVDLMRNARDDRVRGTAAQALLDRGFGKPKVEIQNTNADFRDAMAQVGKVLDEKKREEMRTAADIVLTSKSGKPSKQGYYYHKPLFLKHIYKEQLTYNLKIRSLALYPVELRGLALNATTNRLQPLT